jgi:hypothetical protein
MTYWASAVLIDFAANAIQVQVPDLPEALPGRGVLDVGAQGRLLGLELGDAYIHVMPSHASDEPYMRSATVDVRLSRNPPAITIPRKGAGYEISYPSGNECWQVKTVDGRIMQVCATIAG